MKKILMTSLVALGVVSTANAGVYVGGYLSTDYNQGVELFDNMDLAFTLGYAFDNGIRLETDIFSQSIMTNTEDNFRLGLTAAQPVFFTNFKVAYDIGTWDGFTPYVGLGISFIDYDSIKPVDVFSVAGLAILGVSYAFTPQWSVDFQYNRNMSFAYASWKGGSDTETFGSSTWKLGAVYKF